MMDKATTIPPFGRVKRSQPTAIPSWRMLWAGSCYHHHEGGVSVLVGRLVAASYDVPVYDRPDVLDMIGTAILVAEVVSMLPDVDTK